MVVDMPVGLPTTGYGLDSVKLLRQGLTVQTVQKTRDPMVQFWEGVDTPVGVQTTGLWFRQCRKTVVLQLHSSDKVVDVPDVAVHRRGVDVPANMQ